MEQNADATGRSIDPTIDPTEVSLPTPVGRRIQRLLGADEPPTTVREWMDAHAGPIGDAIDGSPTVDDLCRVPDGAHAFDPADAEERRYVCVLDPLAYPYITDTPGTIRSTTPVREETVEVTITAEGVTTQHEDAVVSLGVADDVDEVEDGDDVDGIEDRDDVDGVEGGDGVTPETIYTETCPYIHAFVDEAEYERWARNAEAVTTSVSLETGVGVASVIARELFGATPAVAGE